MSAIVAVNSSRWTNSQLALIQQQIAMNCNQAEIELFQQVCNRTGLDPFSRQIYAIKRGGKNPKMTIQVSIDGFRVIADRSGKYDGSQTFWADAEGNWHDVWLSSEPPSAAKTVCYRVGSDRPFVAVALWSELAQYETNWENGKASGKKLAALWAQMPAHMLGKVSEAQALRKAFPAELSGLYSTEEMPMPTTIDATIETDETAELTARSSALFKALGWDKQQCVDYLVDNFAVENRKDLTAEQLQELVKKLEALQN